MQCCERAMRHGPVEPGQAARAAQAQWGPMVGNRTLWSSWVRNGTKSNIGCVFLDLSQWEQLPARPSKSSYLHDTKGQQSQARRLWQQVSGLPSQMRPVPPPVLPHGRAPQPLSLAGLLWRSAPPSQHCQDDFQAPLT